MAEGLEIGGSFSRYRVVSKIGEGGMGEVYLAEDTELGRQVALKVLLSEVANDEDRVRRFVQEAKAASALNHPNILTVYEIGTFEDSRFIATELIKGETLRDRLRREPLTLRDVLDVAMQVAAALNAAHNAGIVHRDIKPENIMLRDDGFVKVLDFGLAKLAADPDATADSEDATRAQVNTRPGVIMGTVQYMSPEQARGKETDARCDIWSLGVVMYEMLTKRTPFAGETANDSIAAILTKDPPPLDASTPSELQRIVRKTLQKNTDERYQTVKDLLLDVKNLKRELEFSEDLERSQVPQSTISLNVSTSQVAENATVIHSGVISTQNNMPQQLSSAEYLVGEIRGHKLAVAAGLLILVLATGFLGYRYLGSGASAKQIESIAVMPFVNESGNADVDYLSDGMTETLIGSLSQLPNLSVKARSSVFRYKGKETNPQTIGKELNVQAVLNGRIVQRGDQLILSVELVDVQTENVIWSEQYNRKQSDLISLQSEIARDVSNKLKTKLSGADVAKVEKNTTANPEAYQLYLKGRFFWNKRTRESLKQALEFYKQAVEKDPKYALAYSGMAETYGLFGDYYVSSPKDCMPQAKSAAVKALELDETLAQAHAALGLYLVNFEWDRAGGEKEYRRAIELDPNYATAHQWLATPLQQTKRFGEALVEMKRAEELDPLSPIIGLNVAYALTYAHRYDEAVAQNKRVLVLDPNFAYAHVGLGWTYCAMGMYREALPPLQKAQELSYDPVTTGYMAFAYARLGQRDEAIRLLNELKQESSRGYVPHMAWALAYSGLGQKDEAFASLERDIADRTSIAAYCAIEPLLDDLRGDPRFKAILKELNLPE